MVVNSVIVRITLSWSRRVATRFMTLNIFLYFIVIPKD